jgi:hypothetical protein
LSRWQDVEQFAKLLLANCPCQIAPGKLLMPNCSWQIVHAKLLLANWQFALQINRADILVLISFAEM